MSFNGLVIVRWEFDCGSFGYKWIGRVILWVRIKMYWDIISELYNIKVIEQLCNAEIFVFCEMMSIFYYILNDLVIKRNHHVPFL
jgi:hypothetical protein